ncbi:MAG: hypothetical protein H8E44_02435 [Planctomycetes bacterium]|nr:hypothetical protein [Planctomycetota bacterium]
MPQWKWSLAFCLLIAGTANADDLTYKDRLVEQLASDVPAILKTYDAESGRFGTGIWICRDQHPMYPLAVAYATQGERNKYHKDRELLEVIVKSGDPLIENMDERGRWIFEKKDGSTWGMIWMPWTYSRWIRTFALIRDDMSPDDRKRWEQALKLGYTGISGNCLGHVHNIPAHHAMGLFVAGKTFDRPEWCEQAGDFLAKVAARQSDAGYWSEGVGPVVLYNFVYVDALGTYYGMSKDRRVLPALEKAAAFHRHFTYPDGQNVETVDQRNPYHERVSVGNVGFTFSAVGRAYLANQWTRFGIDNLDADLVASLILYGEEGPVEETPAGDEKQTFVLTEAGVNRAATMRHGSWFVCLSAYTAPIPKSRWTQDRQNMVSIFHDKTGLVLGGGNTKLQPAWSNFTVGDISLLSHKPGDTSPDFLPKGDLHHVPSAAKLVLDPTFGLDLTYGPETCRIRVQPVDEKTLEYTIEATSNSDLPAAAHLTLLPHMNSTLETGAGQSIKIIDEAVSISPEQLGGQVAYAGYRLHLPPTASLHWPALPHNPYRKDGRATAEEGRIEIRIPLDEARSRHKITMEIVD